MKTRCIDEEMLADFLDGRLDGKVLEKTEKHLADCDQCLDMIKIGNGLIRGGALNDTLDVSADITRAAVTAAESLNQTRALSTTEKMSSSFKIVSARVSQWFTHEFGGGAQLAPVRGEWQILSDNVIQVKKKFRSFQAEIEIEKTDNGRATIRVSMISGSREHPGTRVTLKRGDREVSSEIINGAMVVFDEISFGSYSLVFSKKGTTLGNYQFEIKETVNEF